jgi:hypothetical protein
MRRSMPRTVAALVGALFSFAVLASASAPAPQGYFEVVISNPTTLIGKFHTLVKPGGHARVSSAGPGGTPRFRLVYTVEPIPGDELQTTITGFVDDRQVVSGAATVAPGRPSESTLEGGGYRWQVHVEHMTDELLQRRQRQGH